MRKIHCPKCDAELEVEEAEPDVGIMTSGAYCDVCALIVEIPDDGGPDDC
jgi:hypothetical protein